MESHIVAHGGGGDSGVHLVKWSRGIAVRARRIFRNLGFFFLPDFLQIGNGERGETFMNDSEVSGTSVLSVGNFLVTRKYRGKEMKGNSSSSWS